MMKQTLFLIGCIFVGLSCQEEALLESTEELEACSADTTIYNNSIKENFKVDFTLDENNAIVATITPGEGAFFASPESKESLKGYAQLQLEENDFIHTDGSYIESPVSRKSFDPFSQGYINWVYEKTSYTYGTCRKVEEDFEVAGNMCFVIEPECNRYEVGFLLKNTNGKLTIQKTNTVINNLSN